MFKGLRKKEEPTYDLFAVDLEHGTIKRRADGVRILALGSVGWATLEKELTTTFVSGAAVILQRMGYSYGRHLGRVAKSHNKTAQEALETLQSFSRESGIGDLALNGGDLFGGQARLVIKDCIFCLHLKDASEPVCHILVGLIAGVADEVIGGTHRVIEEKCVAQGDTVCEVMVERTG